ncbi:MAG: Fe-S cluster assembly protein SufD [Candidatus Hydrogenedentota bacterium]|jgi:Fe-S cluster assembly protein SufD
MTETLNDISRDRFLADLSAVKPNGSPEWLKKLRADAAARFSGTPWPNTKMEEWRHTNISALVKTEFRALTAPPATLPSTQELAGITFDNQDWPELVIVDGYFAPSLSSGAVPEGVTLVGLHDAIQGPQAAIVEKHLNQYLGERSAYTALNSAFLQDGAFVHVAKNVAVESPIHLLFVTTGREVNTAANLRNLIVLEPGAQATIIASYISLAGDTAYLNNVVEEVAVGQNARLEYYRVVREGAQGNHLATIEVRHERDAYCKTYSFSLEGGIIRNQLCTDLAGENAECNLAGLYLNDGKRLLDNALEITHRVPNCRSRILYKGILDGESKAVFAGRVNVHRDAQKTDSDQLSNNLLLSDTATIDAKPQLEIYADDVKCTHGATIGSPPEKIIFYFRSRGIAEDMARAMLTYGFADEVVDEVEVEPLQEWLNDYIYKRYSPIA